MRKHVAAICIALIISLPLNISLVMAQNRPPNLQALPDISFYQTSADQVITLDDYVIDPDNTKESLVWDISSSGSEISAHIDPDRNLVFSISPPKFVTEVFTVTVRDPGGLEDKDTMSVTAMRMPDGGQTCRAQIDSAKKNYDYLGSKVSTIEQIVYAAWAICTVAQTIEMIISILSVVFPGSVERMFDCTAEKVAAPPAKGAAIAACTVTDAISHKVGAWYGAMNTVCCFITCGWCSSYTSSSSGGGGASAGCPPPTGIFSYLTLGVDYAGVSIDPFENIFTAMICLCPVAILFNLRKMQMIYSVYDCCIELSCEEGFDKQVCDDFLSEAECMFFEGAMQKTLIKILAKILVTKIAEYVATEYGISVSGPWGTIVRIVTVPLMIANMLSILTFVTKTFDEPSGPECRNQFGSNYAPDVADVVDLEEYYNPSVSSGIILKDYYPAEEIDYGIRTNLQKDWNNRAAFDAFWAMISFGLDEWALDSIDESCKAETQGSRPRHPGPQANILISSVENLMYCTEEDVTITHAEGTIKRHSSSKFELDMTWLVTNCNRHLGVQNYAIWAVTSAGLYHQLDHGMIIFDEAKTGNIRINLTSNFWKIQVWNEDPESPNGGKPEFELNII